MKVQTSPSNKKPTREGRREGGQSTGMNFPGDHTVAAPERNYWGDGDTCASGSVPLWGASPSPFTKHTMAQERETLLWLVKHQFYQHKRSSLVHIQVPFYLHLLEVQARPLEQSVKHYNVKSSLSMSAGNAHRFWDAREGPEKDAGSKPMTSRTAELPWAATLSLYLQDAFPPNPASEQGLWLSWGEHLQFPAARLSDLTCTSRQYQCSAFSVQSSCKYLQSPALYTMCVLHLTEKSC